MAFALKTLDQPHAADEILGRIGALRAADVGLWGSMSVGEMVCHLHTCYMGAALGTIPEAPPLGPPKLILKWGALRLPTRWPRGVKTLPALERSGTAYVAPGVFADEVEKLSAALALFLSTRDIRQDHPYFGAMQPWDWMRWGYLHADHHLRQFGR